MTNSPIPDDIFSPAADAAVLRLSLNELVARSEDDLRDDGLFRRAARSSLYAAPWRAAGVRPDRLAGRVGLRSLPFLRGADLIAMNASGRTIKSALLAPPRAWVTSHGAAGVRKWLPLTLADTARWFARARRVDGLLGGAIAGPATALALNEPMPLVSNAVPYLWERADQLLGCQQIEFIVAAMSMLPRNHWDQFVLRKQPDWLMASVADARALAAEMGLAGERKLTALRRGFFWGAPLDGPDDARSELAALYGLAETFSLYFSAECREMAAECPAHAGLHLWLDGAIHEILLDPAADAPASARTCFVEEAAAGTGGEYVLTTFDEALPLVRYRTGDRIRVVSTAPCACGSTHPRVQFLGRL